MDTTVDFLGSICRDAFWNSTLTLTSNWPEFTECFTFTVLSWPACILFLLALPFRLATLCHSSKTGKHSPGRITVLLIIRCMGTACLAGLTIVLITLPRSSISYVEMASHGVRFITYTSVTFLMVYERRKHVIGSLLLFHFWTALLITDCFFVCRSIYLETNETHKIVPGINLLLYSLVLLEFFLCFFPDLERDHPCETKKNPWLEYYCSIPSRIWFTWLARIMYIAWRKKVTQEDIYDIPEHMAGHRLQKEFDFTWKKVVEQEDKTSSPRWNIESVCSRIIGIFESFCSRYRERTSDNGSVHLTNVSPLPSDYGSIKSTVETQSDTSSTKLQNGHVGLADKVTLTLPASENQHLQVPNCRSKKDIPFSLIKVVLRLHGPSFLLGAFFKTASDMMLVLQPLLIRQIIASVTERDSESPMWIAVMLCLGLFFLGIIRSATGTHCIYVGSKMGVTLKSEVMLAIFQKATRLCNKARQNYTIGEIITLMSVDAERVQEIRFAPYFAILPFVIIVTAVLLYYTIGISMLAGIIMLLLLFPTNGFITSRIRHLQSRNMKLKGQRVKLVTDVLKGIKVLKLYAWEKAFEEKVSEIRSRETRILCKIAILKVALNTINWFAPFAVTLTTFATYVLISEHGRLDPVTAFVSLTYFAILKSPLSQFTFIVNSLSLAMVSLKRINDFLHCENASPYVGSNPEEGNVLSLRNATFSWSDDMTPAIPKATLHIAPQTLTIMAGKVGSGKSSLLSGILGEMNLINGSVDVRGSVAYVSQQAWVQNASVRDNILFGSNFDRTRYESVLEACALVNDLMILPNGDLTEIGEKGCNLSGGQKQRVALARAVYKQQSIYLMDDPLSAVDSHVGKHIFDNVIGPSGLLKDKTRILVTHGVQWLSAADTILVMHDGDVVFQGTYNNMLESRDFLHILQLADVNSGKNEQEGDTSSDDGLSNTEMDEHDKHITDVSMEEDSYLQSYKDPDNDELGSMSVLDLIQGTGNGDGSLITAERMAEGRVKLRIIFDWFMAGGLVLIATYFLAGLSTQALTAFSGFWLKFWTDDYLKEDFDESKQRSKFRVGVYAACGAGQLLCFVIASSSFWTCSVVASRNMHKKMLKSILESPMKFFDSTPLGRLLNRFSVDTDGLDEKLPQSLTDFMKTSFQVTATIFIVCINVPMFITIIIPLILLFYGMSAVFLPAARQLKRIESVSKSPIYTGFGEFVSGTSMIKAFGQTERFFNESRTRVDLSTARGLLFWAVTVWSFLLTDMITTVFIFGVAIFAVTSTDVDGGDTGLAISYSMEFTVIAIFMIRQATEVTANLICVERILEFSHLPPEGQSNSKPNPGHDCPQGQSYSKPNPGHDWPQKGQIEFKDFSIRYRDGLDLVLKNITATVQPCEKIAIVGRTGAGKSSMTLALFRIIEAAGGSLIIDNVNIADVDLMTLRSKLSILPQDPVLFSSSLRMNLDPYNEYSDEEIMKALQQAHLDEFVKEKSEGLSFDVGEEGKNMSVGERQLICLARALLRQNKILVLDEATAAVDVHTDSLIQETIRTAFKDCTILTIAHRIHTIMDYDRVMVLASGELKEFASVKDLLSNSNSLFYSLAREAGFA